MKRHNKCVNLATKSVDALVGSRSYYTPPAHMLSPYVMKFKISSTVGTCLGTTRRKLFGTLGTEQLRTTSCGVLSLRTPKQNFVYTPDPDLDMCQGVGRRKKKRIRNNTDEA
jgi:hypothetical protein